MLVVVCWCLVAAVCVFVVCVVLLLLLLLLRGGELEALAVVVLGEVVNAGKLMATAPRHGTNILFWVYSYQKLTLHLDWC